MPTKKPRLNVTLPDEVYATISRLAALQGQSRSAFVTALLISLEEPFARTVSLLEAAKAAPASLHSHLRQAAQAAELDLMAALDSGSTALRSMISDARSASRGGKPPLTNRGVRLESNSQKRGGRCDLPTPPICPTCGQLGCPGAWGDHCVGTPDFPDEGGCRA